MNAYTCLISVHVTAHTDNERERAVRVVGRLLGNGNVHNVDGIWGDCPVEIDSVFSHWTNPTNVLLFRRLCRLLTLLRVALRQEAVFVEFITPISPFAIVIEAGDSWQSVFNQVITLIRPNLPDWLDPLAIPVNLDRISAR
jgi:hypothetical protein